MALQFELLARFNSGGDIKSDFTLPDKVGGNILSLSLNFPEPKREKSKDPINNWESMYTLKSISNR